MNIKWVLIAMVAIGAIGLIYMYAGMLLPVRTTVQLPAFPAMEPYKICAGHRTIVVQASDGTLINGLSGLTLRRTCVYIIADRVSGQYSAVTVDPAE